MWPFKNGNVQPIAVGLEDYAHWARNTFMSPGTCYKVHWSSPLFFRGGGMKAGNSTSIVLNFTNTGLALVIL